MKGPVALNRAVALGRPQCRAPTLPSSETPRLPGTLRPEAVPPTPRPAMAATGTRLLSLALPGWTVRADGPAAWPLRVASPALRDASQSHPRCSFF